MRKKICLFILFVVLISSLCMSSVYAYDQIDREIFNFDLYISKNPDVYNAFGNNYNRVIEHWLNNGIAEGREGSSEFDAKYYLSKYEDLRNAFGQDYKKAYNHYKKHGINEGRIAHPGKTPTPAPVTPIPVTPKPLPVYDELDKKIFNFDLYIKNNSDVYNTYGNNYDLVISHWLNHGIQEGRKGSNEFDGIYYLNRYEDLKNAFGKDYKKAYNHYKTNGINEGRTAHPSKIENGILKGSFLKDNGRWNTHQFFGKYTDSKKVKNVKLTTGELKSFDKTAILNEVKTDGYNCINIYLINQYNYSNKHDSSVASKEASEGGWKDINPYPTKFTKEDSAEWESWLRTLRDNGINPIIWLMSNGPMEKKFFDRGDKNIKGNKYISSQVTTLWKNFDDNIGSKTYGNGRLVTNYVLSLEADEYWSLSQIREYARIMKNDVLKGDNRVSLGIHNAYKYKSQNKTTNSVNTNIKSIFECEHFDTIYYQYDNADQNAYSEEVITDMVNITKDLVNTFGKRVVATEYNFYGESSWAKKIGYRCVHEGRASGAMTGYGIQ